MSIVKEPDGLYRSSLLSQFDWLVHAFGTAVSVPGAAYLTLQQIHSTRVLATRDCVPGTEGDALVVDEPGVMVAVKTADCVPLLIADPVRRAAAAVHAGWRGTLSNIASAAVLKMTEVFGSRAGDLHAAIGPSIGVCCFEVGPEVAVLFRHIFPERADLEQKCKVDLRDANRRQLLAAGLRASNLDTNPPCTFCAGAEFFSWRRDRVQGERMFSMIGVRDRH